MGALAAGGSLAAFGTAAGQEGQEEDDWLPPGTSEAHVAVLSGRQANTQTTAGGCAHITPLEENTISVDLVLEDIQCVTQAHIHEGKRGEDGPIVAPLFEYTENLDGTGAGDPLTTTPDSPLIEGARIEDSELVDDLLANPEEYYVNVHTVHNPGGEVRGQIRGFDLGQETDLEPQPAEFRVSSLEPRNITVVRGDSFDVSAIIRNDGDITEKQTVQLRVDGNVVAEEVLELSCRQVTSVSFENVGTDNLVPGEYEYGIHTDDDFETGTLTVLEPPEFVVSDLDPMNVTVTQGDVIDVSATIENVGEATGTQIIEFRVGDDIERGQEFDVFEEQQLTLEGSESETVTFSDIDTAPLEPGEYQHGIFSEDDFEIGSLNVEPESEPAEFLVSELDPVDATITQGDLIDVSATIENVGEAPGEQTIELRVSDDIVEAEEFDIFEEQPLELDAGEEQTVTFSDVDTAVLEPSEYEHGIFSEDDSAAGTLTVEDEPEPAEFLVSGLTPDELSLTPGELITVSATIENVGEATGTQTIEFRAGEDIEAGEAFEILVEQELELAGGESDTIEFEDVDTADLEPGEYEYGIFSDDDSETGPLTVEEVDEAEFTVSDLDPDELNISPGEPVTVSAIIENAGEVTGTQSIEFRAGEDIEEGEEFEILEEQELTLDGGAEEPVNFENVETDVLEPGEYDFGIFSDDDFETGPLTVEEEVEPAEFLVSELDPLDVTVTQGDLIDVSATITNDGEQEGTQDVELRIDEELAEQVDAEEDDLDLAFTETQILTLGAGEEETVAFEDVDTADLDPGEYEHGIFTDDDSETGTLTVEEDDDDDTDGGNEGDGGDGEGDGDGPGDG